MISLSNVDDRPPNQNNGQVVTDSSGKSLFPIDCNLKIVLMEDGVKRKLPSWMSRVNTTTNTADEAEKRKGVQTSNNLKDETAFLSLPLSSKGTTKQLKRDPSSAHETLDIELKKRKRKKLYQEADETLVQRKKGNSGGKKVKTKREEPSHERSEKIESPSPSKDDGELTVEDLLTIAQEYVIRDENSPKQQLSDEYCDGKTNSNIKGTVSVHNFISRSKDPAQDMLDLFLGPLLKNPVSDDKRINTIEEDKTFVREVKEQLRDNSIATDFVPFTKKKSSLKDKVAMFLD